MIVMKSVGNFTLCAPASLKMVIQYINGTSPTQGTLRNNVGSAPTTDAIARVLNQYVGSGEYEYVNLSNASFIGSLTYSIDQDKPLIFQILAGPPLDNYVAIGEGHYIVGTGYEIYLMGGIAIELVHYNDPHHDDSIFGEHVDTIDDMEEAIDNRTGWFVRGT